MDAKDVEDLLRMRPFRPLRFFLSDGQHADVFHPEMATLRRFALVVHPPGADSLDSDDPSLVSLMHIVRIDFINRDGTLIMNGRYKG